MIMIFLSICSIRVMETCIISYYRGFKLGYNYVTKISDFGIYYGIESFSPSNIFEDICSCIYMQISTKILKPPNSSQSDNSEPKCYKVTWLMVEQAEKTYTFPKCVKKHKKSW